MQVSTHARTRTKLHSNVPTHPPHTSDTAHLNFLDPRFFQDARWLNGSKGENSVVADLVMVDKGGMAVPHVMLYASRTIPHGKEVLQDWGEECWRNYQQVATQEHCAQC